MTAPSIPPASPDVPSNPTRVSGRWWVAAALSALWHVLVLGLLVVLDPFAPTDIAARPMEPLQLRFTPLAAADRTEVPRATAKDDDAPERITELPANRADLAPERADALSNVDSRVRDRATGENYTEQPRLEGRSEAAEVGMDAAAPAATEAGLGDAGNEGESEQGRAEIPAAVVEAEASAPQTDPGTASEGIQAGPSEESRLTRSGAGQVEGTGAPAQPGSDPQAERYDGRPLQPEGQPRFLVGSGQLDVFQEAGDNPSGNVPLFGDVSLNTVAWDFMPWIQRFKREYYRNWLPPYAYLIGVIHGHQVVYLEVAPDGRILKLDVLEEKGHESLRESTLATFRAFAPYQPLPKDFPEETLQITIKVSYLKPRR